MILFANAGVPMLAIVWPMMWLAFIPVVLIEAVLAVKKLSLGFRQSVKILAIANAISTLVGIPISWLVMLGMELLGMLALGDGLGANTHTWQKLLTAVLSAAWLPPYEQELDWRVPLAAIILCVPFYLISVWIEYMVIRRLITNPSRQVAHFCWWANFASYTMIIVFGAVFFAV